MSRYNRYLLSFSIISLGLLVYLSYFANRTSFEQIIIPFGLLFIVYGLQFSLIKFSGLTKIAFWSAILFRAALLFSTPNLSDDFYRYIWDGACLVDGVNPYSIIPADYVSLTSSSIQQQIYPYLNSQVFYSIYPPINQFVFCVASFLFPNSILGQISVMKGFILLFEIGSITLLIKLLKHYKLPVYLVYLYALNPLVIIELSGNIHFEAAMLFFLLLGIWLWVNNKAIFAGLSLAAAICTKFWPLFLLPFFFKKDMIKQTLLLYISTILGVCMFFTFFWFNDLLPNLYSSISLYFSYFEFNASIYYLFGFLSEFIFNENYFKTYPLILNVLFALILIALATKALTVNNKTLPKNILFTFTAYLLLATTIHPWYIVPLIALGVLSGYIYPLVWSVFIVLSYYTYSTTNFDQPFGFYWIEYCAVFAVMLFEIFIRSSAFWFKLMQKQMLKRAEIKLKRIEEHLTKGQHILDIGAGNGALAHLLKQQGYSIETIDVVNKSKFDDINPIVYNGEKLPFEDDSFDVILLITVLHHTKQPETVLEEAKRVGKSIIVIEDVYSNTLQKYLTFFTDSVVNNEFWGHPHTNKEDISWGNIFKKLSVNLVFTKKERFLAFFNQTTFILKK